MSCAPLVGIVDDDEALLGSLTNLLRSLGLRVAAYSSAGRFLEAADRDHVDCLILDARLRDMSGLRLARELAGGPHPPFIYSSADVDERVRGEALRLGAVAVLTKPCREADLVAAIRTALDRGITRREDPMAG